MPKVVSHATAMSNHGSLYVFCTSNETENIADATERAGSWMNIFSSVLDPASMIAIRAVAAFIPWKARRSLKRNKCLMISVAPIPTLHEYDPYDSNDGWYQIYSSLFLVNGISMAEARSKAVSFPWLCCPASSQARVTLECSPTPFLARCPTACIREN